MKILKRFAALSLAALLSATALSVSAADNTPFEKGKRGTWYSLVWSDTSGTDNLYQPFRLNATNNLSENEGNLQRDGAIVTAQRMKAWLDQQPDGKRGLNPLALYAPIRDADRRKADNYWWIDESVQEVCDNLEELLYYYDRLGGKPLDIYMSDLEHDFNVWYLEYYPIRNIATMEEIFDSITSDPRYETDIRPEVIKWGVTLYEGDDHNELYNMYANMNTGAPNSEGKKDVYNGILFANARSSRYWNRIYDVVKKHYPDVKYSEYGHDDWANPDDIIESNGHMYGKWQNSLPKEEREYAFTVGTHSSWPVYGNINTAMVNNPPEEYPFDTYTNTPFNCALYQTIEMQNVVSFRDDAKMQPWMGSYTYGYNTCSLAATDYWYELMYHFAMGNPDPFLLFNAHNGVYGIDDNLLFSDVLHLLDDIVGFEDRKTLIEDITPWDSHYLLNGMYAGGKNVWRITPDLFVEDMTIEDFKVKDSPLTFHIAEQIVEFPEGSYIYTPENEHSKSGYWVISPEGTRPTERRDPNIKPAAQTDYVFEGISVIQSRVDAILAEEGKGQNTSDKTGATVTPVMKFTKRYKDIFAKLFEAAKAQAEQSGVTEK